MCTTQTSPSNTSSTTTCCAQVTTILRPVCFCLHGTAQDGSHPRLTRAVVKTYRNDDDMERELHFLQMLAESVCSHLVPTILGESVGVHRLTGCEHHSVTLSLFHGRTLRSCVRVTDHGTRLRQRSRIESLVVQLGRLVHKATGVHHGALSFAHVLWVCAPPQGVVDDSSDAVQLDDLRLVDFTQATQNEQIPCVPGLCSCYPEHFMVDAWTLGESKDHQTLEAMADAFASGPAPALPRDMLMEAAPGGVAQEMFLAGVKNNGGPDCAGSIQDAVRLNKYDWQGVCHALCGMHQHRRQIHRCIAPGRQPS